MTLRDKLVLVLGAGPTGHSMARYLHSQGARLRFADSRTDLALASELKRTYPNAPIHLGEFHSALFDGVDLVAASPGVPLNTPLMRSLYLRRIPVVGDVELFAQALPASQKIIAITGANGKTTVTTLCTDLCRAAGLTTVVAGNIGPMVLDQLPNPGEAWPDVYVLELSSFQLDTTYSLRASVATVLNISEDHLDRYSSLLAYAASKERLLTMSAQQVLNLDDPLVRQMAQLGLNPSYFSIESSAEFWLSGETLMQHDSALCKANELNLIGKHNLANALAALALLSALAISLDAKVIDCLKQFKGLPHRVERIATIDKVDYIDDSKGTNVGATVAALNGLGKPTVLIAGGDGKSQDFGPLRPAIEHACKAVCLIGKDSYTIAKVLSDIKVPVYEVGELAAAVTKAKSLAQAGDAVLLSPACASTDQFRNYLHRSEVFAQEVAKC